ncbi:hypothetical protein ACFL0M_16350, partial [Thermodesulfobacteriota bacterium]
TDDRMDELEDTVLTAESYAIRPMLADLRRQCIGLRRYIAPQRDVLLICFSMCLFPRYHFVLKGYI